MRGCPQALPHKPLNRGFILVEMRSWFAPTGVRDTLLLSALVSRRPGARWMRVGVYHHAGSIAPLHTPVSGRGAPFRLRILDFIFSRLHLFTSKLQNRFILKLPDAMKPSIFIKNVKI